MTKKEFFIMANKHGEGCGTPPSTTNVLNNHYYGYFENVYGEQWTFVFNREAKTGELRGGDVGWDNVYPVNNGQVGLILNDLEKAWLKACWNSAAGIL